jgi:hypothetical protein
MCYYAATRSHKHGGASFADTTLHLFYGVGGWIDRKWSRGVHGVLSLVLSPGPGCSCVMRESFYGRFREDTRKIISAVMHEISYSIIELNISMNITWSSITFAQGYSALATTRQGL